MADDAKRHALRASFDASPELYDRARYVAPSQVFDDFVALGQLEPGARILEIGCGTGQATLPLAERAFEIVAIELGEHMAELARRRLARYPEVSVVTSSFEKWDPAGTSFDAVVSFNAFHWIDPEIRYRKSAEVLRDGGALAVLGSRFVEHDQADPVWTELQEDYEAVTGAGEPRMHVDALKDRSAEFTASGYFTNVTLKRYLWDMTFDADGYVALLGTTSSHSALADSTRDELFGRIHQRISSGGGTISPTMAAVLYVAQRS
jgi:SAM-dependent methyltransferase